MNIISDRSEPWQIPIEILIFSTVYLFMQKIIDCLIKKLPIQATIWISIYLMQRLYNRRSLETLSKAAIISSSNTEAILFLFHEL